MISCSHWGMHDIPEVVPSRLNEICRQQMGQYANAANSLNQYNQIHQNSAQNYNYDAIYLHGSNKLNG